MYKEEKAPLKRQKLKLNLTNNDITCVIFTLHL